MATVCDYITISECSLDETLIYYYQDKRLYLFAKLTGKTEHLLFGGSLCAIASIFHQLNPLTRTRYEVHRFGVIE